MSNTSSLDSLKHTISKSRENDFLSEKTAQKICNKIEFPIKCEEIKEIKILHNYREEDSHQIILKLSKDTIFQFLQIQSIKQYKFNNKIFKV